jgi:ferredoxin
MIVTTFYFSGTGNTKWAAEQFHLAALEKGQTSRVYSIEQKNMDLSNIIRDTDILGVAFPVYAMNLPDIMKQFLAGLNKALPAKPRPMPLFVITTVGYADGCGPYEAVRQFSADTVRLAGYTGLKIANNISTPSAKTAPLSPEELKKRLDIAKNKISALADALAAGRRKIESGVYRIAVFRKQMSNLPRKAAEQLSINAETCKQCLACADNCPSDAIVKNDQGALTVLPACTACMRCYNICPTASVWHNGQYADPAEYVRYRGPATVLVNDD